MRNKACERCGDFSATQMVGGEDLCVECANRASRLRAADRRASSLGIDYAELALGVEERDAELVRLTAELAAMTECKDGWRRVALYWRNEARFFISALISDGYLSLYIPLGSQARRRLRKAEQSGQQAGE